MAIGKRRFAAWMEGLKKRPRGAFGHTSRKDGSESVKKAKEAMSLGPGTAAKQISRRPAGGQDIGIQIGRDAPSPKEGGAASTDLRFEIEEQESVKDVESQESHQQETFDGVGIVPEYMIGLPAGG